MPFPLRRLVAVLAIGVLLIAGLAYDVSPAGAALSIDCGSRIRKNATSYWKCTFADEFNGSTLDRTKWAVQDTATSGYHSGQECFVDSPNNVAVSGGYLRLTVRSEASGFVCKSPWGYYWTQYTSGMVTTYGKFSQTYGRFEVRAKFPAATVQGLQETLWLWPVDPNKYGGWPASGEVDFAESYSQFADRVIPYVHYSSATYDPNATNNNCLLTAGQFHTYTVEWTPAKLTVSYDGQTCIADDWNPAAPLVQPQPFDQPFLLALTQALGVGSNGFVAGLTPLPATTFVDYVHVWS